MGVSLDVRRTRFANLVRRTLDEARQRGMTITDIEKATGVTKTTFYRWRDGDWARDPSGTHVNDFFTALNVPVAAAHHALDWATPETSGAVDPPLEPEFQAILRKLNDPGVPESEKQFLRESIKMLASRGGSQGTDRRRAV